MTVKDIITDTDVLKTNQYNDDQKRAWLSDLDKRIYNDLIVTRADFNEEEDEVVFPYEDTDHELILDSRDMYIYYLMAQIDFFNAEYTRYNNEMAAFNAAYADAAYRFNRQNVAKATRWTNF